ncbi:MAG: hypothetical protein J0M33_21495 [Anaerolineae bacterium]|nr:hypothetical protein [Anaerolineae bacterium]
MWLFQSPEPALQSTEWFRDPAWLAVILAVVAIIVGAGVSIFIFLRQNKRKTLSYEIRSYVPLLNVDSQVKDKLQITYNGKVVNDLKLLVVRLLNDGDIPIESRDFDEMVSVDLGETAEILIAEISSAQPKELKAKVTSEKNRALLQPLLLNQTDWVELKLIVAGASSHPKVAGRIVGVKSIKTIQQNTFMIRYLIVYSFIGVLAFSSILLAVRWLQDDNISEPLLLGISTVMALLLTAMQPFTQRKSSISDE